MTDWEEFQSDVAYDEYAVKQYEAEIAEEGVEAFSRECLQAYYRQNPTVAKKPLSALHMAEDLADTSASASLVFAAICLELTVKSVILHPLVYGLVHNEAVASFVAQCAVGRGGPSRFDHLLLRLLHELADVDLKAYRREGATVCLWEEIICVTKLRNSVLHAGQEATGDQARTALDVSRTLLCVVFPEVVQALDMTMDDELRIV